MMVEVEFFNVGKGARSWKSGFVGGDPTADDLLRQVRAMAHVPDGVAVEWSIVSKGCGRLMVASQEVGTFRTIAGNGKGSA